MDSVFQVSWTVLAVAAVITCAIQASLVQNLYMKLEAGQSITGEIETELKARSPQECALRCSSDVQCEAYQHHTSEQHGCNCVLVESVGIIHDQSQTFVSNENQVIYKKEVWVEPEGWNGPGPAAYRSLDTMTAVEVWDGNATSDAEALVVGNVGYAVASAANDSNIWINLGIMDEACITRPDTCGPEDAAVAFWLKIKFTSLEDGDPSGVLSSRSDNTSTGYTCYWITSAGDWRNFRCDLFLSGGKLSAGHWAFPFNWHYVVLNYIGPNDGQGIRLWMDSQREGSDTSLTLGSFSPTDGRLTVGRNHGSRTEEVRAKSSADIDELLFFNVKLSEDQMIKLYNQYEPENF